MSIKKIIEITVNHTFYKNGQCNNFDMIMDDSTSQFINKNRFIIKKEGNTWNLYTMNENYSGLWINDDIENNSITLCMKIRSSDDYFYKSILNTDSETEINCLCNKNGENFLNAVSCNDKQCKKWQKRNPVFSKMDWNINLEFDKETFLDNEKKIAIQFNSKKVLWKYFIFTDSDTSSMEIIDSESIIRFENNGVEKFPDGRIANTFISNVKIPLTVNDEHQFRLIINKNGAVKNIVKRLPIANVNGIRYQENSKDDLVSLIFIHI